MLNRVIFECIYIENALRNYFTFTNRGYLSKSDTYILLVCIRWESWKGNFYRSFHKALLPSSPSRAQSHVKHPFSFLWYPNVQLFSLKHGRWGQAVVFFSAKKWVHSVEGILD